MTGTIGLLVLFVHGNEKVEDAVPLFKYVELESMFRLSCVHVRAHTGRETSAHKKTCSAQKNSFQKWFCTYFMHIVTYTDESW